MDETRSEEKQPSREEAAAMRVLVPRARQADASADEIVLDALRAIRSHLGMDVAFVSEFAEGRRRFRYVDAVREQTHVRVGQSDPLEGSYCQRVVDGRLPEIIPDAQALPETLALPATREANVRAHISVPIRLSDGRIYGTFCCFSTRPDPSLGERDRALMRMFADFAAQQIERHLDVSRQREEMHARVAAVLEAGAFRSVYQPIFDLASDRVIGFEALTRFTATPTRGPDVWFDEACQAGLGPQMETAAMGAALAILPQLPAGMRLALNVSPDAVLSGAVSRVLRDVALDRILLEVTEHAEVIDYTGLRRVIDPMRAHGLQLAVDDAGAGYSSFRHILRLEPDLIKLDIALVRDIDLDRTRRSLAAALIRFAQETGSRIVAEGVETQAELETLRELRVDEAQGYLLGRPMPLADALAMSSGAATPGH